MAESLAFPYLRAEVATEALAVAAVRDQVQAKIRRRKVVQIDVTDDPLMAYAGVFAGEAGEALQEICDEAYRLRDADRPA